MVLLIMIQAPKQAKIKQFPIQLCHQHINAEQRVANWHTTTRTLHCTVFVLNPLTSFLAIHQMPAADDSSVDLQRLRLDQLFND